MSAGRRLWYGFLVLLIRAFLTVLWSTCRLQPVAGLSHLTALRTEGRTAVLAYWHQMHVFCAWLLFREARAGLKLGFLTSPSVTGEVPAAIIAHYGAIPIRGSSTRSAGSALREMFDIVSRDRTSLAITADGPKGPMHEFKPGAIMLAKMARVPIVPIAWAARPCWRARSWDRFMVPLPFSRVALAIGEPWDVPRSASVADLGPECRQLERQLAALAAQAEALLD